MTAATGHSRLLVVGANQRTSGVSLRERLFVEPEDVPEFLHGVRDTGISHGCLLSTCDRVEMVLTHEDADEASGIVIDALAARAGFSVLALSEECVQLEGRDAVQHFFEIAASLDSLVVGEPQVLGQVKDAHRIARDAGMVDNLLNTLFEAAYRTAKRVRTETAIGERPVSIAAAAERLALNIHGPLSGINALIIGAGEMGELIAEHFRNRGLERLTAIARIEAQATMLARRLGGHHASFDDLESCLRDSDVVISAVGAGRHVISRVQMESVLSARRRKPVFLIDTGVPADIPPQINELDSAFVYDLGDLENVATEGRAGRDEEAIMAARIIQEEVENYLKARAGREAGSAVSALRKHFEDVRDSVVSENLNDVDAATRLLVNRLLHTPSETLRKIAEVEGSELSEIEIAIQKLFRLSDQPDDDDGGSER
ncbi:MAG: glutamyl-tRNA reductase [Rhodospirillaceae bacterium]|nr:glutamyl-tRNA reductase [Rhodospirillaceae bacterium]|tara:strand:- start:24261 stop:25550 length:1290 start_codon:yes stop_codon:yes gene_type:complete